MLAPPGELAPPPRGNPGFATGSILDNLGFATLLQTRVSFLRFYVFTLRRLCFYTCLSVHRGVGGSASVHAGIPPPREQTPPQADIPPGADPPDQTLPSADGYCCGRYASYWNAFLFFRHFGAFFFFLTGILLT